MSISSFAFRFSTGHTGIAKLFQVMKGRGGKVRVGFIGAKAAAPKKAGTDTSLDALSASLKGTSDRELRGHMRTALREAQGARKAEAAGKTVAEVAASHEFGLGVPPRSMIRAWTDRNREMIRADIRKAMEKIAIGRLTPELALKVLGVKWVASIQEYIATASNFKPLSEFTIDRKGSSAPLIDTGQMRSSVTYEVLKG